jgi:ATP-dependent protease HslVU (ClpYQ) peptidase subunit
MFGLFKKKTPLEKLQEKHAQLLKEAFELSKTNRKASDLKTAEAAQLADEIAKLKA